MKHSNHSIQYYAGRHIVRLFTDNLSHDFLFHNFHHTANVVRGVRDIGKHLELTKEQMEVQELAAWFLETRFINYLKNFIMNVRPFFIFTLIFISLPALGQNSPYKLNWKKEISFFGASVASVGTGYYLSTLPPLFTLDELMTLDPNDINAFDRTAVGLSSPTMGQASDFLMLGSHIAPFLFLGNRKTRSHFGQIITLYGEAASFNLGMTIIAKSTFKRPRPFVFDPNFPEAQKLTKGARASFVSGHTSLVAVNTFFAAQVYSDFFPDSKWKPFVWGAAIAIPAVTGYYRVASGNHYPTDVIAGYALGAGIGMLVPRLHRNKKLQQAGLQLNVGYNSASLTWNIGSNPRSKRL